MVYIAKLHLIEFLIKFRVLSITNFLVVRIYRYHKNVSLILPQKKKESLKGEIYKEKLRGINFLVAAL